MRNILGLFRTQIFKQNKYNLNFRAKISVRSIWIFETKISTLNFLKFANILISTRKNETFFIFFTHCV